MEIILLDPRPASRAAELGRLIEPAIGVEVTVPELAEGCVMHVDGQHGPDADGTPAVELALRMLESVWPTRDWPAPGAAAQAQRNGRYATVRPDRDAFSAIAILASPGYYGPSLREGAKGEEIRARIMQIADADRNAPKAPGPQDPGSGDVDLFAALGAAVADHAVPVGDRFTWVDEWLKYGRFDLGDRNAAQVKYADQVARLRRDVERLEGAVALAHGGRVGVIETTSPMGVVAAYRRADIVVALNPAHRWPQGQATRKFTVCQQPGSGLDTAGLTAELNAAQPGWGGLAGATVGSPQGQEPAIGLDELVELVGRYLT